MAVFETRPDHIAANFGRNLRRIRKDRGLTQPELAAAAKVTRNAIAKLERGHRHPRLDTLIALAVSLDVSPADLLVRNDEPPPPPGQVAYRAAEVLRYVEANPGCSIRQLEEAMGVSRGGLVRSLSQLREAGKIKRGVPLFAIDQESKI
jgi:DNA-binding XRE family transcriptional regulator